MKKEVITTLNVINLFCWFIIIFHCNSWANWCICLILTWL